MRCNESRHIFVVRDQLPVSGSSYCLAIHSCYVISIFFVLHGLSAITSLLSHIG